MNVNVRRKRKRRSLDDGMLECWKAVLELWRPVLIAVKVNGNGMLEARVKMFRMICH